MGKNVIKFNNTTVIFFFGKNKLIVELQNYRFKQNFALFASNLRFTLGFLIIFEREWHYTLCCINSIVLFTVDVIRSSFSPLLVSLFIDCRFVFSCCVEHILEKNSSNEIDHVLKFSE